MVPESIKWSWPCWRLIAEGKASFIEVTEKMSIIDILDLAEAMDAIAEAKYKLEKQQERSK